MIKSSSLLSIKKQVYKIGVISDTHGLLRPEVKTEFADVDCIIHAGDIGGKQILQELQEIAPVIAVRGNTDNPCTYPELDSFGILETDDFKVYILHNLDHLDLDPKISGFRLVIYGHSHKPQTFYKNTVLYLNPGSAGPKRFRLPACIAVLKVNNGRISTCNIEIG